MNTPRQSTIDLDAFSHHLWDKFPRKGKCIPVGSIDLLNFFVSLKTLGVFSSVFRFQGLVKITKHVTPRLPQKLSAYLYIHFAGWGTQQHSSWRTPKTFSDGVAILDTFVWLHPSSIRSLHQPVCNDTGGSTGSILMCRVRITQLQGVPSRTFHFWSPYIAATKGKKARIVDSPPSIFRPHQNLISFHPSSIACFLLLLLYSIRSNHAPRVPGAFLSVFQATPPSLSVLLRWCKCSRGPQRATRSSFKYRYFVVL
jgi:hypothetical protein